MDQYRNSVYQHQTIAAVPAPPQYYDPSTGAPSTAGNLDSLVPQPAIAPPSSALAPSTQQSMIKTDSHAVLMELFARDQDLVRQATEFAAKVAAGQSPDNPPSGPTVVAPHQLGDYQQSQSQTQQTVSSQHPMKTPSQGRLVNVPTLNSWPHFSSVSSLNNLGTMPGVKSITSLSAADLAKQGAVNSVGNLAQVKSVESMGRNDSYAFLEVFFGDRSSNALGSMGGNASKDQRGVKRERDEDNDVGLSLEDESPSAVAGHSLRHDSMGPSGPLSDLSSNPFAGGTGAFDSSDTLKRAYDDAMAARGLISVSRSSEKLTDLALPATIQRTLSQEFMRQKQSAQLPQSYEHYQFKPAATDQINGGNQSHQYSAQHSNQSDQGGHSEVTNDSGVGASVAVPSATKCAICLQTNVDTQLRPCGHMFHEKCLKPTLQASVSAPRCPIDHTPMLSALLAIPTDDNATTRATVPVTAQSNTWGNAHLQEQRQVASDSNR